MSVRRHLAVQGGHLVWVVPALATLTVGLAGIGHAQPWRDELATWTAVTRPIGDLFRLTGTVDAATGPYYLLLHGWVVLFGDSATALRTPSALAMAGAAGLTAVLGRRLLGARAGLLAGLAFTVLPGTSRYAQEARPYALTTLFAVLTTLLLVAALDRPGWTRWAGYAAAVAGLGLAHLLALTLLGAHAVVVLVAWWRGPTAAGLGAGDHSSRAPARDRRLLRWPLALLPAAAVLAPLLLTARSQRSNQLDWVEPARLPDLAALPGAVAQSGVLGGLLVGLAALGAGRAGRRALVPGVCVLLPVLLVYVAALAVPLWVPRYLLFTVPFGCLLAGAALAAVPAPAALAVVVLAGGLSLPDQQALRRSHGWPRSATVDYRGAAAVIAAGQRPGDVVVYSPRDGWLFLDLGVAYHLGARRPRDVLVVREQRQRADLWATECARPAECLAGAGRVWLVVAGRRDDPLAAVPGAKGDALRAGFTVEQVRPRAGVTVALLSRPG
ncbi:glycosyltransferase family 39 protein [Micromonospora sp. CPCC 205556]|uniref:glycosyltransferase family 39 protein n=1 Tax=Micromonospora sp. CPCC 205556 TaxID=3122398 RepID=UPI002FF2D5D4